MSSLNKVFIMGRLGQDPELRYTQTQKAFCNLNVATSEFYVDQTGQRQEKTDWHRVNVWGKQAENVARYLKKGRSVLVEGSLHTRQWEDAQGQKRYSTEVRARNVTFLSQNRSNLPDEEYASSSQSQVPSFSSSPAVDNGGGFPAATPNSTAGDFHNYGGTVKDIPSEPPLPVIQEESDPNSGAEPILPF